MLSLVRPRDASSDVPTAHLDETLDAMGLEQQLSQRLAQDADGRPFEPAQIEQSEDLLAHLALLLRREPLGGAEAQIRDNERRVRGTLTEGLNAALARRTDTPRTLLTGLLGAARARKEQVDAQLREVEDRFATLQTRLHRWQERAGQRSDSLGTDIWRWLVGSADRLSLPEAVALWNEREYLAIQRGALAAAQACFAAALDALGSLLGRLDTRIDEARRLMLALAQEREQLRLAPTCYAPWTLQLNEALLANTLLGRADAELALATLLRALSGNEAPDLDAQVRLVAHEAANRLLVGLSLAELVALEAEGAAEAEHDGLVVVGQALLEAVAQPTWQLTRRARARRETVQVTPDGAPVYSLEGLGSAAYGDTLDRMGFVQVQLGVCLADLAVIAESEELFCTAQAQRNLYVLDELAVAAAPAALVALPGVRQVPAAPDEAV
jgi:hypothetical protein